MRFYQDNCRWTLVEFSGFDAYHAVFDVVYATYAVFPCNLV
jgi:hypothetical protein